MARQGAVVVDGVGVPELDRSPVPRVFCNRFKHDIEQYLASLGPQAPVKTLAEIVESGRFHPSIEWRMREAQGEPPPDDNPRCREADENGRRLGELRAQAHGRTPGWTRSCTRRGTTRRG